MCGIAVYLGPQEGIGREFVERANALQAHRGPDAGSVWVRNGVSLGHRRLSILDLSSAGNQPMTSPDGRFVLVYNGEVYNHRELRQSFCRDWNFQSSSDSETVLALLSLRGAAALDDMVGMWAFALWDSKTQRLTVARDRYGQKPLYWRNLNDGSIVLASEVKPLLDLQERPVVHLPAVAEFLARGLYGHEPDRSFFRDVHQFPAAHWGTFVAGDKHPELHRYWRFPADRIGTGGDLTKDSIERFRATFIEAVRSQTLSDVPIGATLSGGLDSSAVVGALACRVDREIELFTAQTPGAPLDESRFVESVVRKWKGRFRLNKVDLNGLRLSEHLEATVLSQEEPFGDPSIIAHRMLMESARSAGVAVILGGQGADELLGGYPFMWGAIIGAMLRAGSLRESMNALPAVHRTSGEVARILVGSFFPGALSRVRALAKARRSWTLAPELRAALQGTSGERLSEVSGAWCTAVEGAALPHMTHYDDRNAMAFSVEGRMPFLDHRLAESIADLPLRAFLRDGRSKWILREACADMLPADVAARTDKVGFYTPLLAMMQKERGWVRERLVSGAAARIGLFNPDVLMHPLIGDHKTSHTSMMALWRALVTSAWFDAFRVRMP